MVSCRLARTCVRVCVHRHCKLDQVFLQRVTRRYIIKYKVGMADPENVILLFDY